MRRPWTKGIIVAALSLASPALLGQEEATPPPHEAQWGPHRPHPLFGDSEYRSPGLAVALSLTPMPVDFGNLYAENLGWGVAYTSIELTLALPAMWLGVGHMWHGGAGDSCNAWSTSEQEFLVGLVVAYVGVKIVAAMQAGAAAREFNEW